MRERGQTLLEVLIGTAILAVVITLGVTVMLAALRASRSSGEVTQAARLLEEELERVVPLARASWSNVYTLTKGDDYFVIASGTSQRIVQGVEGVLGDDVTKGLVGLWRFDEATSTIAYDATQNNNNGTLINGPARLSGTNCKVGGCLSFDGTNDYVSVPDSSTWDFGSADFTITAWVKRSGRFCAVNTGPYGTNGCAIIERSGTTDNLDSYSWYLVSSEDTNWNAQFFSRDTSNTGPSFYLGIPDDNAWTHYAVTRQGTNFYGFKNGVLVSTASVAAGYTIKDPTSGALYIGVDARYLSNNWVLSGLIDDVRIYNRALSASEITQLYRSKIYTRKFQVSNVQRNPSGDIVSSGGTDDPSTQKITVTAGWEGGGQGLAMSSYISRSRSEVTQQSDWSGGAGVEGPVSVFPGTSGYASSTGIITTSTQGEITLSPLD